jgi:hypothetical protein
MLGNSWVAAQSAASQEGLSSVSEWVKQIYLRRLLPPFSRNSVFGAPYERSLFPFKHQAMMNKDTVKLSLCLSNWALRREGVWGSRCIHPHFLDLCTSWRWVVSTHPGRFTSGNESPVQIGEEVGWTPEQVWTTSKTKNSSLYRDSNSRPLVVSPLPVAIPTELSRHILEYRIWAKSVQAPRRSIRTYIHTSGIR